MLLEKTCSALAWALHVGTGSYFPGIRSAEPTSVEDGGRLQTVKSPGAVC